MSTLKCDVLVVGAGPAGSMTAKTSAEGGLSTILIEQKQAIGSPVHCAEGVNKFLFQDTGIKKNNSFIRQKINGVRIYFYDEVYELDTEQWRGYTIDRKVFDKYLAIQAAIVGARVLVGTKAIGMKRKGGRWIIKTKSLRGLENIEAKIVVGADGFECSIGRYIGIRDRWKLNEFSRGYNLEIFGLNIPKNDVWYVAFGEEFIGGYGWLFPKGRKHANVGVAVSPKMNIKKSFDFFISKYPHLCDIIGDDYSIGEIRGGSVPTCGPKSLEETIADGVILVGNAGGMVEPLTGEGIGPSMISGIAAGETAISCIEKNNWNKEYLSEYQKRWMSKRYIKSNLGENMNFLIQLKEPFYNAFTNKKIPKKVREEFITMLLEK